MKTIYIKLCHIFSFLIIIFPAKILLPNGIVLILSFLDLVSELFETKNFYIDMYYLLEIMALISLALSLMKHRMINLIGILFQFVYLIYAFKKGDLNNIFYVFTISFYLLMTLALIFQLFYRKQKAIPKEQ